MYCNNNRALSYNAAMVKLNVYDESSGGKWGEFFNIYVENSVVCDNLGDMLLKLNNLYDSLCFPMSSYELRTFGNSEDDSNNKRKEDIIKYHDDNEFSIYEFLRNEDTGKSGAFKQHKKNTEKVFYIQTIYRQNVSMQGRILYVENEEKKYCESFRSAFELLYIINDVLTGKKNTIKKAEVFSR